MYFFFFFVLWTCTVALQWRHSITSNTAKPNRFTCIISSFSVSCCNDSSCSCKDQWKEWTYSGKAKCTFILSWQTRLPLPFNFYEGLHNASTSMPNHSFILFESRYTTCSTRSWSIPEQTPTQRYCMPAPYWPWSEKAPYPFLPFPGSWPGRRELKQR